MFTRQLMLVFAGGLLVAPVADAASPARVAVSARLYNTARVPATVTETALGVASRALVAAHIDVAWLNCDAVSCDDPPGAQELVVRLVRSNDSPEAALSLELGYASIDRRERSGVLATLYVDRVERMAEFSAVDTASLLGRAIAHELGHLLLATHAHSATGLMRATWSSSDIRRNDGGDWVLTPKEAAAIRRRLQ